MPETKLDQEVNEFDDAFNEIVDKTDEELAQEAVDEALKNTDEASGDAQKDQSEDKPAEQKPVEDPIPSDVDQQKAADTSTKETSFYEDRIKELEEQLAKETQRTASWDGRIKAANKRVKELEAENKKLTEQLLELNSNKSSKSGDSQSDEEVMATFRETFPELVEVIDIMQRKIDAKATAPTTPAKESTYVPDDDDEEDEGEKLKAEMEKVRQEHLNTIRKAHPGMDEMVSTGVLKSWINTQPEYIQPHLNQIYKTGSSNQIIKMISEFVEQTGWKSQLDNKGNSKQDKLKSMMDTGNNSPGEVSGTPDNSDFAAAAKEAGL
jgi:hypothetical protein